MRTNNNWAPVVSRRLKEAGFITACDFRRYGLKVMRSIRHGQVTVVALYDTEERAVEVATQAATMLRTYGYGVVQKEHYLQVEKQETQPK